MLGFLGSQETVCGEELACRRFQTCKCSAHKTVLVKEMIHTRNCL